MKIISERPFTRFEAWSGGKDTQDRIIEEGKEEAFESQIEKLYPDGLTDTELNDLLWFDSESVFEWLGIKDEDEEPEEENEPCEICGRVDDNHLLDKKHTEE